MNLQVMKYFLLVAQERSISKGAAKAHVSQSALSQMIQKFEEDLGLPLLERSNRGVSLTEAGEIVQKHVSSIILKYDQMLKSLQAIHRGQQKININGTHSMAAYSLPCLLYKLKKAFPQFDYALEARSTEDIIRDVREGLVDFGFVDIDNSDNEDLKFYPMGRERVVLIAQDNYPVPESISVDDLLQFEMVLCTTNKHACDRLEDELVRAGKDIRSLNIIFNADSLSAVKSSVAKGYGMAFVPYESVKRELYEKSIKIVAVDNLDMDYDIFLVTRPSKDIVQPYQQILKFVLQAGVSIFC